KTKDLGSNGDETCVDNSALADARLSGIAGLCEAALPGERMLDDGVEMVELWSPTKVCAQARAVGDDCGGVAGPAAGELDGKIALAHALDRVEHLEHRLAVAVAAVVGRIVSTGAQMRQRRRMCAHEIADMDVIA